MNPLMFANIKGILMAVPVILAAAFWYLWRSEVSDFASYRAEIGAAVAVQEKRTDEINSKYQEITKATEAKHENDLANLRKYYAERMRTSNGSCAMPGISKPPVSIDAVPSDALPIAEQCAETTLQLVNLQRWVKDTESVK